MTKKIKYHKNVLLFFDSLYDVLIEKGYFSFYQTSAKYIEDLVLFVEENIETTPHKEAPAHFANYGNQLHYISYIRNKQTTWYIFFEMTPNHYFIKHITNNHVSGHLLG